MLHICQYQELFHRFQKQKTKMFYPIYYDSCIQPWNCFIVCVFVYVGIINVFAICQSKTASALVCIYEYVPLHLYESNIIMHTHVIHYMYLQNGLIKLIKNIAIVDDACSKKACSVFSSFFLLCNKICLYQQCAERTAW